MQLGKGWRERRALQRGTPILPLEMRSNLRRVHRDNATGLSCEKNSPGQCFSSLIQVEREDLESVGPGWLGDLAFLTSS